MLLLCAEGNARLTSLLAKGPEGYESRHIRHDRTIASVEDPTRERTGSDNTLNNNFHFFMVTKQNSKGKTA
jgi:hypothetical protein